MSHSALDTLHTLRAASGPRKTVGLDDAAIARFVATDPLLAQAIDEAGEAHAELMQTHGELLALPELEATAAVQADYVNFYAPEAVNPYIALSGRGPWIVTAHGAVLHDSGGYGMLGFGHAPQAILDHMARPWVIANIMTPSITHKRFADALKAEVGHSRPGGCPFDRFICMNSGSEAVTVASRIADLLARTQTETDGAHAGKTIKFLAIKGGFHGRTDRPAQASSSSSGKYTELLASFRDRDNLVTVPPNDVPALRAAFAQAARDGVYFELMLMEPVMGEGNPGMATTREFYDAARELTLAHGTLLLVDSIQAAIRAQGCLSIVDYPGFEDAPCPDMETWSKALNAAQFPLSVLGLSERAAELYAVGVYGNTMTTNPRALEVAIATLAEVTPALRTNIRDRGVEFVEKLEAVARELPGAITSVQGTGLLLCAELDPDRFPVVGFGCVEEHMRIQGVGVIHGGKNALRFTPHFRITSEEIDLVCDKVRLTLQHFAAQAAAA